MILKTQLKPRNFYDVYVRDITPKLEKIDLLLKTSRGVSADDAAELLGVTREEVVRLMREERITKLNCRNFINLMRRGASDICGYVSRELECGSPVTYTKDDIAYIYNLNIDDVTKACDATGISEATAYTLPRLFSHIPV